MNCPKTNSQKSLKPSIRAQIHLVIVLASALALSSCSHLSTQDSARKAKLYLQIATDHLNRGNYKQALEETLRAIEHDPKSPAAYNHLALVYMETKRYKKSEQAFLKALQLRPSYPEVFNNLGVLLTRRGQYQKSITYFRKALEDGNYATPENAFTNIGYAYFKLGDTRRAKKYHLQALDLVPQFCLAGKNLGDIYAQEKNYRKASEYYEQAVTNCPLYQESHFKLGLAWMKLGKRNVAKSELEKLVQRHKAGPYVDRSNRVLKYLK